MVRAVSPEDVAQQVACVLQIDSDAGFTSYGVAGIDARTAASILRSTPILQAAVKSALGDRAPAARFQDWLVVNAVPTGARFLEVEIILLRGDTGDDADERRALKLMSALCEALKGALSESADSQRQTAQERRKKAEQDVAVARERLAEVRATIRTYRTETGVVSQHGTDPRYALNNLRNQRQQYEQQLAGYRARVKSLEPSSSPLVAEWRSVVELRQKQLAEMKAQAGKDKASADDLAAQEQRVAEAKSQLEAYRSSAAAEANQARNRSGEISSLETQIAQVESQLKPIEEQIAKLEDPKTVEMIEELPELQNEEMRVRNDLTEATTRGDQIRRAVDAMGEIRLRVLDGLPDGQPSSR